MQPNQYNGYPFLHISYLIIEYFMMIARWLSIYLKEQKGIIQSSDRVRRRKKTLDTNSFFPLEFDWIKTSQTQVDKIFVFFTYELLCFTTLFTCGSRRGNGGWVKSHRAYQWQWYLTQVLSPLCDYEVIAQSMKQLCQKISTSLLYSCCRC